jgi:raffinose/stachyose/melibiose transport system permease protein
MNLSRKKFREKGLAYLFVLPALALVLVFMLIPLIRSVYLSFFSWNGMGTPEAVGLDNYVELAFSIFVVFFTVSIGLLLAIAIDRRVRGWAVYKFIYYIPVMVSMTVAAVLFTKILEPNYGFVNMLLEKIGLGNLAQSWLGDPKYALASIIAITVWQYSGFTMILFIAALNGIHPSVHEAATLDGVTEFKRMFYVTIPSIKRSIFVVVMLQMIFSFKSFDTVWIMTKGGPGTTTEIMSTLLLKTAFNYQDFGNASAVAVIMIVLIAAISGIYLKLSKVGDQVVE